MTAKEAAFDELLAATVASENERAPFTHRGKSYPATPGWAAAIKRLGEAWARARAIHRSEQ
jgi:hypothetical protein